jgi:Cu/Zn superoxide dismutase
MSLSVCAIAVFDSKIKGTVRFTETTDNHVEIEIHLTGLKKNHLHGFHVHDVPRTNINRNLCLSRYGANNIDHDEGG